MVLMFIQFLIFVVTHVLSIKVTSYHFISIDGSPLIDSQHPIPSQTTTQPSTYDSPIPSSTPQAPSSPQQPTDSPSLPPSVTLSLAPATFQEQTPDIFEEEHTPHTFQQHTPNTSDQQHTHSPPVTSQSPGPHATTSQPPQTQSNLQRPTHEKKRNPKCFNEKYVNTASKHPLPQTLEPTTELVPKSSHVPIGCKWVFRVKRKPDGTIDKYKARIVAKGFLQEPVPDVIILRPLVQFLNPSRSGSSCPPGYIHPQFPNHICKLRKALYGLKQAPRAWLFLSQHRHIADLLSRFNMVGAKEVSTTLSSTETLLLNDGSHTVDSSSYRSIVGSLQYLAITRLDVSFAVNKLSQFMHAPTQLHLQALKRVLPRQKSVSRSSTEAEYKALANASAEMMWVQNLLNELGISLHETPTLFCNNTGATYLCANPVYHSCMKHVAHFVLERVSEGSLRVLHISSKDQLVDMLTKPLGRS
ncbi:retrovirus-related pol polyprotein from transposon RE1 [Tanacetum coccineum]